jgi:hypothetical protein
MNGLVKDKDIESYFDTERGGEWASGRMGERENG